MHVSSTSKISSREALEQELGDRVRSSPHFREGVAAFREKRRPEYQRPPAVPRRMR